MLHSHIGNTNEYNKNYDLFQNIVTGLFMWIRGINRTDLEEYVRVMYMPFNM